MSDALLDADRDFYVDPRTGTGATVSGARLVAQDVREAIEIPRGSLPWDRNAGSDILSWLGMEGQSAGSIIAELERIARRDARILSASVAAKRLAGEKRYRLTFEVIGLGGGVQAITIDGARAPSLAGVLLARPNDPLYARPNDPLRARPAG